MSIDYGLRHRVALLEAAGGGGTKSTILFWGSKAQGGALVPFEAGDVLKDEIGVTVNPVDAPHQILLPKGYFSAKLMVNLVIPNMGSANDEWSSGIMVTAGGYTNGDLIPAGLGGAPMDYDFVSGTLDSVNSQACSISHLFESGAQDLHTLGLSEHAFALFTASLAITDVTAGVSLFTGTSGFTTDFSTQMLLHIVQLGSKA